jgi:hypothetical protein
MAAFSSTTTIAYELALQTGVTIIAATVKMEMVDPNKADGRFKTDGEFIKITTSTQIIEETVPNPDKSWWQFWEPETITTIKEKRVFNKSESLGKEISADDYVVK